jgi:hypothetical protein
MKSNASPSLYFSAYPLKAAAAEQQGTISSPYLKAILCGKTRTLSRVRVMPMINPYKEVKQPLRLKSNLPNDIELTEKEWYNNYE